MLCLQLLQGIMSLSCGVKQIMWVGAQYKQTDELSPSTCRASSAAGVGQHMSPGFYRGWVACHVARNTKPDSSYSGSASSCGLLCVKTMPPATPVLYYGPPFYLLVEMSTVAQGIFGLYGFQYRRRYLMELIFVYVLHVGIFSSSCPTQKISLHWWPTS